MGGADAAVALEASCQNKRYVVPQRRTDAAIAKETPKAPAAQKKAAKQAATAAKQGCVAAQRRDAQPQFQAMPMPVAVLIPMPVVLLAAQPYGHWMQLNPCWQAGGAQEAAQHEQEAKMSPPGWRQRRKQAKLSLPEWLEQNAPL